MAKWLSSRLINDLLPENNATLEVIPQIITNDADFLFVSLICTRIRYKELNWNLGCPYLWLQNVDGFRINATPKKIEEILHKVQNESDIIVSMKMRLGYDTTEEI
jgi:tRNA-dihydrouridine synthase